MAEIPNSLPRRQAGKFSAKGGSASGGQIPNKFQAPNYKFKKFGNCNFGFGVSQQGFTLIEAVVSISVFAVAVTSIVGVYLSVQKLNQQSTALQLLQQNGRSLSEGITKFIRNGQVDYSRYPSGTVQEPSTSDLYLIDQDGVNIRIYKSGDNLMIDKGGSNISAFSGSEVKVLDFKAYIWPANDPFGSGEIKEQPTVTLLLDLESNINQRDKVRIPFEITASRRQYPK